MKAQKLRGRQFMSEALLEVGTRCVCAAKMESYCLSLSVQRLNDSKVFDTIAKKRKEIESQFMNYDNFLVFFSLEICTCSDATGVMR